MGGWLRLLSRAHSGFNRLTHRPPRRRCCIRTTTGVCSTSGLPASVSEPAPCAAFIARSAMARCRSRAGSSRASPSSIRAESLSRCRTTAPPPRACWTWRRLSITSEPPAFPPDAELVGLDVRTNLPPLLRPDMLMDWEAWWEWERRAVDTIGRPERSPEQALALLSAAVEAVRRWTPDDGALLSAIHDGFVSAATGRGQRPIFRSALSDALSAIPADLRPARVERLDSPSATAARAFLAAHAFANWTAHLGQGLRSWLRSLEAAWALVNELGVRQTDLILRHLADPNELANVWSRAEVGLSQAFAIGSLANCYLKIRH